ncbi:MAG: glycosyltransferase [Pseudomonadota bacterium]
MLHPNKLSVIVTTYNAPDHLALVLEHLNQQTVDTDYEVVVADDGSTPQTRGLIESLSGSLKYPLIHAWQEDRGFRAGAARNRAVERATGDYLVFLDGDCLVFPDFVEKHFALAEPGWMVRGSRVMLGKEFSQRIIAGAESPRRESNWWRLRFSGQVNRLGPLLRLPFMQRRLSTKWYGVKTCNLGVWRCDFELVNGFDERYIGWGHEDADLAVRLLNNGVRRKEGRHFIPVLHFWHARNDRSRESDNKARLDETIHKNIKVTRHGLKPEGEIDTCVAEFHVLHVNFAKGFRGGERQTELLVKAMAERGIRQSVLLRHDSPLVERLMDVPRLSVRVARKPYTLNAAARRGQYSLVHAHETKAAQWAYLNWRRHGVPYVITRRVAKVPGRTAFTRAMYENAEKVVCLSRAVKNKLELASPASNASIIPSMCARLDVDPAEVANIRKPYTDRYLILNVGALVISKGQRELMDAFKRVKKHHAVSLLLLGEGNDETRLRDWAAGDPDIHFLGFCKNVGDYLAAADQFAFPSHEEGLGSTLLDAMEAELPIVASDVDGIPDIVRHDDNGLLVPAKNSAALAEAMQFLIEHPDEARRLAASGKAGISDFYPPAIAARYWTLYQGLICEPV